MGRARLLQTLRRLDLGRRIPHGAGRVPRAFRSPLARRAGKSLRYVVPLLVFAALVAFFAVGLTRDPREVPSPFIDKPAPPFKLETLHQPDRVFTPDDMKGKVWLLNVWASWCASCRIEHPLLVEMSQKRLVPIVGLNYKDRREDGTQWLTRFGDPYA